MGIFVSISPFFLCACKLLLEIGHSDSVPSLSAKNQDWVVLLGRMIGGALSGRKICWVLMEFFPQEGQVSGLKG